MNFEALVADIQKNNWNVYGVEVYKDRNLIFSYGDTNENIHDMYSATKSVVSIAVGIASDRGLFDINKNILEYMPSKYVEQMDFNQIDLFKPVTVQRLLCMSVDGIPFRTECDDFLKEALSSQLIHPEEHRFNYSNLSTYLVCVALTEALGEDLGHFIEREIFVPLDITRFAYERSPEGYFYGASKMRLSVHDLSKFGILMLDGTYDGKRILSSQYVKEATSIQQMNREGGYGYYFWKYRDGFSINGKLHQKCYVLPSKGIIISHLANIEDDSHELKYSIEQNLLA